MASRYPAQIDSSSTLPTVIDNFTPVTGGAVNRIRDAIVYVESELGIKPSGVYGTVRARLDVLENAIGSGGGGGSFTPAGDLGGTGMSQIVIGLRGNPISSNTPSTNDALVWSGSQWSPTSIITGTTWTAADVYIDAINGDDTNDGLTSGTAFATHNAFYLKTRGGKILPPQDPLSLANLLTVHILSTLPTTDPINLDCILGQDVVIRYVGGVNTTLTTGTLTGVTVADPSTNQPFELIDTSLVGTWTDYIGKRVRITTAGSRLNTIMWVAKDLGSTTARVSWPAVPAEFDPTAVTTYGDTAVFLIDNYPKVPQVGDTYAIEELFQVTMGSILIRGMGPDVEFWFPAMAFSQLEFMGIGIFSPELPSGFFYLSSVKCGNQFSSRVVEETYFANCYFPTGIFGEGASFLTQITGGLVGAAVGSSGICGNGGRLQLNNDVMIQGASVRGTNVAIQSACVFDAAQSLTSSGSGVDVGKLQLHTSQEFDIPSGGMGLGRTQTLQHDASIRLWGSGNAAYGLNVSSGCSFYYVSTSVPTITGASGDFSIGAGTTSHALADSAYSGPIANSWANFILPITSAGFEGNAHNPELDAHLVSDTPSTAGPTWLKAFIDEADSITKYRAADGTITPITIFNDLQLGLTGASTTGVIRLKNADHITARDVSDTIDYSIAYLDASNYVTLGDPGGGSFLQLLGGGTDIIIGNAMRISASVIAAELPITFGTIPATTGDIRLSNTGLINFRNITNDADIVGIGNDASNNIFVGGNIDGSLGAGQVFISPASFGYLRAGGTSAALWNSTNLMPATPVIGYNCQYGVHGGIAVTPPADADYIVDASVYCFDWIEFDNNTIVWTTDHSVIFPTVAKAGGYYKTIFNNIGFTITVSTGIGTTQTIIDGSVRRYWFDDNGVNNVLLLSIVDADISASATIAYSKLSLTGNIVDADVSVSAAISVSKLASGTSAQILLNTSTPTPTWITLSGDMTVSSTGVTSVAKVNGTTYGSGGSLTTGQVPRVTGASTTAYGPLDLSNANAITGSLPATNGGIGAVSFALARATPLDANHLHAWELDDASGNFVDTGSSTAKVNLTANGTPLYGSSGLFGACAIFNRSNTGTSVTSTGSAPIASFSDLPTTNFTMEVWYRSERFNPSYICGADFSGQRTFQLWNNGDTSGANLAVSANSGGGSLSTLSGIQCTTPNVWSYAAVVYDTTGSKLILYINGEVVGQVTYSTAITWAVDGTSKMWIAGSAANPGVTGQCAKFRISNIVRSQAYLRAVYKKAILA